jgi:hypothetical protein
MVAQVMRWAGMIGAVVCAFLLARHGAADWLDGESVTWAEPDGLIHYTRELSAGAGGFVRFFMVAALPWPAIIAITAATVGLRSPSVRWVAFLLPLVAGAAFAGAASDNTGRRLRGVDDPRNVAALHDSTTVAAVVFGFLALASIALLVRLHVVYSVMLVLLYTAVAGYYVAGAVALSGEFGAGEAVHVTGAPRTHAILAVAAAVCALVTTVGVALLPRLPRRRPVLVVRGSVGTVRVVREFVQSIAIGVTPSRDVPGYEPRPQVRVLLLGGLTGVLMSGAALVLGFGVDHPAPSVPDRPAGITGSPSPSRSSR